jgi:hypothetical protein
MPDSGCAHIAAITSVKQPKRRKCGECVKIGAMGSPSDVSTVRKDALLRQLT